MAGERILVIEDEEDIQELIRFNLEKEKYRVTCRGSGEDGLKAALSDAPDLVLLDLMLPGLSGEEVCRQLRQEGSRTPVIMLTAKTALEEKVYGLAIGADDYVVKPFSPQEVVARVKALLRRSDPEQVPLTDIITMAGGALEIDTLAHRITWNKKPLNLTPTEFNLLLHLARHPERVFSRAQLAEAIFGYDSITEDRTIDAHIKNLRQKMLNVGTPVLVKTIYGVGYKYEEN